MFSLKKMMELGAQVVVDAPPDKVFSYVTDFDRHHEWFVWETGIEKTFQGPVGVGSTFRRVGYKWFGLFGWYPLELVVTECEPNERLVLERRAPGGFRMRTSIHLEPDPASGGTRVTVRREAVLDRWWKWVTWVPLLPVLPVFAPFFRRKVQGMGPRLKEYYQSPAL